MTVKATSPQKLLIVEDLHGKRAIVLEPCFYSIGRGSDCDITLRSPVVSRHHASIFAVSYPGQESPSFWIVDGNAQKERSKNGLIINGKRKLSHELKHGDLIVFGGGAKASYHITPTHNMILAEQTASQFSTLLPSLQHDLGTTQLVSPAQIQEDYDAEIRRLASFSELLPHPIVELNLDGEITYLNPAALLEFPEHQNIQNQSGNHPLLADFVPAMYAYQNSLIRRMVQVGDRIFDQSIHFLPESQLIRCYSFDITERYTTEMALRQSEATNQALIAAIPDTLLRLQSDGKLLHFHAPSHLPLPIDLSQAIPNSLADYLPNVIWDKIRTALNQAFECPSPDIQIFEVTWGSGNLERIFEGRCVAISEQEALLVLRDITRRKQTENTIRQQAFCDALTGLQNRIAFDQALEQMLHTADVCESTHFGVMFVDLDRFKMINDTLGHDVGDEVLKQFAKRLEQCVRTTDLVARWGGDEFTILLPEVVNEQVVCEIAQRILNSLDTPFVVGDRHLKVGSSIGIALYPQHGVDNSTLLKHADTALYQAKDSGRNNYQLYRAEMNVRVEEQLTLEQALREALEREEFTISYQPQLDLATGDVVLVEALLRWQHPHFGMVSPSRFVPIAEETGLIVAMDHWLLRQACIQLKAWHGMGFPHLKLSVNLSIRQFERPRFSLELQRILQDVELSPNFVELELTEGLLSKNMDRARSVLKQLSNVGFSLALDDFGTGYSSLGYLKHFPFNALKIDRSFICNLHEDSCDAAIVSAILTLGQGLNLRVVAEGVETREQMAWLQRVNCTAAQGYCIAPPLSPVEVAKFLFDQRWLVDNPEIESPILLRSTWHSAS